MEHKIKMLLSQIFLVAAVAAGTTNGSPAAKRATPTVYLAGDSTMAKTSNPLDGEFISPLSPFNGVLC